MVVQNVVAVQVKIVEVVKDVVVRQAMLEMPNRPNLVDRFDHAKTTNQSKFQRSTVVSKWVSEKLHNNFCLFYNFFNVDEKNIFMQ